LGHVACKIVPGNGLFVVSGGTLNLTHCATERPSAPAAEDLCSGLNHTL